MKLCCSCKIQTLVVVSAALAILSVLMILFFHNYPTLAKDRTIKAMLFKNNTDSFDRFHTTKDLENLRLSFYVFNVKNVDEIITSSAKMELEQVGPFVYSEYKEKVIIDNNQTSGLITYKLLTRYVFDSNLSIANPTVYKVTWPNVPLIVARGFLDKLSFIPKNLAYLALNQAISKYNESAFITDTVENFLFDGSKRELFEHLQKADVFKFLNPWPLQDNKFGLLYNKNFTWNYKTDRLYTTSAGFGINQTYKDLNRFIYINGTTLPFWAEEPPTCNVIGGTDGQFFSPFIDSSAPLEVYSSIICRKMSLKFNQTITLRGIKANEYCLDERNIISGLKEPENKCYCISKTPDGKDSPTCQYDGLIDLSSCVLPKIVASLPQFFQGSPDLRTRVVGLAQPDPLIHQPIIQVEPNTGLTIKASVPLQFNVLLEKGGFKIFDFFQDIDALVLPLVWVLESSEVTEDQAYLLRTKLIFLDSWMVVLVLGGAMFLIIAILIAVSILFTRRSVEGTETEPLLRGAE